MHLFKTPKQFATVIAAGVLLSACGTTTTDRTVSGGLLGAGTGAIIGSVTGSAGNGALIGGLGGAAGYHHRHYASRTAANTPRCVSRETSTARITTCPKPR